MTEYKAIVKLKIPEVQFSASDDLTQDELETEVFRTMLETASARLGMKESECSAEELISELYDIQIERVKTELNPCPICGSSNMQVKEMGVGFARSWVVVCDDCNMAFFYQKVGFIDKNDMIEFWNKKVND